MNATLSALKALGVTNPQAVAAVKAVATAEDRWADPANQPDAPRFIHVKPRSSYWLCDEDIFWTEAQIDNELNGLSGIEYTLWKELRDVRNAEAEELDDIKQLRPHDQALNREHEVITLYAETHDLTDSFEDEHTNTAQPSGPWYFDTITGHASSMWQASYIVERQLQDDTRDIDTSFQFREQEPPILHQQDPMFAAVPRNKLKPSTLALIAAIDTAPEDWG